MQVPDNTMPTPEQIEAVTREVLARPEFGTRAEPAGSSWLEEVLQWLAGRETGSSLIGSGLLTVVMWILVVVVVTYLIAMLVREIPLRTARTGKTRRKATIALEGQADTWEEALTLAREALAKGDHHRAIWIMHRLALGALDERGELHFARWKTNTDYLREIGDDTDDLLHRLTAAYDRIVYAHGSGDDEVLAAFIDEVDRVRGIA